MMKTWAVPYQRTCRGTTTVEAETAGEAEALVNSGDFEHDYGEEMVDWSAGSAREEK